MPGPRPKLEKLATPITSNFPSAITSANTATPLSALPVLPNLDLEFIKTPISPPPAYTDFLAKAMSLNSPLVASEETTPESTPATTDASEKADSSKHEQSSPSTSMASSKPSPPTSATLPAFDRASAVERAFASASASLVPPSPFTKAPLSAPLTGPTSFPSFKLPPSPAVSNLDSPMSAVPLSAINLLNSPYSARSVRSVFDWDAALKAHYAEQKRAKSARTSVRHIREVVTRTITYTPRMKPAPRGKRRKVE